MGISGKQSRTRSPPRKPAPTDVSPRKRRSAPLPVPMRGSMRSAVLPRVPRFVTPGQAAYAGSGFAPSSDEYHTTPGMRSQRRFGSFSPGNASPEYHFPACADFLNRFGHEERKRRARSLFLKKARVAG